MDQQKRIDEVVKPLRVKMASGRCIMNQKRIDEETAFLIDLD